MKNIVLLVVILLIFAAVSLKGQHIIAYPSYVFAQSVLDTTQADQPVLLMFFQAIDKSELRIFVFAYGTGKYLGEMLVLPNGMREFYPFEYEEKKHEENKKKKAKGSRALFGG